MIWSPTANTFDVSTANTVYDSVFVRITNDTAAGITVTHHGANTSVYNGTFVVAPNETVTIRKSPDDLLAATAGIPMVPIDVWSP